MEALIEIHGLEVFGYHGVLDQERRDGQRFVYDVQLVVHDAGTRTDRLDDTVDYVAVADLIREISAARTYNLIEALAATIADELIHRFRVSRARVRVRKPEVQLGSPVEYTAATVERLRR